MASRRELCQWALIGLAASITCSNHIYGQEGNLDSERNRALFTNETFGGNGRTCATCHSLKTGTISPQDAQTRFSKDPSDPLFLSDRSDDGQGHGVYRMTHHATVLIRIPLPPNVSLGDDSSARFVILRRGIPTTQNTPALDPVLMLDGREPDLPTQALHAIQQHAQPSMMPSLRDLSGISQFELTEPFYSSPVLRAYARGGPPPELPRGKTDSEKRGRRFFEDTPFDPLSPGAKEGSCAFCHSGPMLNQTNAFFVDATSGSPFPSVPQGSRFQTVGVSEINSAGNPIRLFMFHNPDGSQITVWSPDPGRALITGRSDPGPNSDLNSFKIPTLWGVQHTAPYFHDNSARTLEDVAAHYARFFLTIPARVVLSDQDQKDIVAYMRLL